MKMSWNSIILLFFIFMNIVYGDRDPFHPDLKPFEHHTKVYPPEEETQEFWKSAAQNRLKWEVEHQPIVRQAKNVIIFLGDGMGVSTQTAARIAKGQQEGLVGGEQESLSFEQFPHVALSRTYCVDNTVADSACSATAYLGGVKGPKATIGVTAAVKYKECEGQLKPENQVDSIMAWAQAKGKATGIVTTNRITDASPAGAYAHVAYRGWESDDDVEDDGQDSQVCDDIAEQLVRNSPGNGFDVILGGGRREFLPHSEADIEEPEHHGHRGDGADLIQEWADMAESQGLSHQYLTSGKALRELTNFSVDRLLGLFSRTHMEYSLERTEQMDDPTLEDMTRAALGVLGTREHGYVVFIEAGLIDHGHHGNKAREAIDETLQLDRAVTAALEMVDLDETLIVVTADHSHGFTLNGYPPRGNDIFGIAEDGSDHLPYTSLLYATGPGYKEPASDGSRYDISGDDMTQAEYRFIAAVPKTSGSHAGEDVAIHAIGPMAHLFRGVYQQNYIPHILAYAACIGEGRTYCDE